MSTGASILASLTPEQKDLLLRRLAKLNKDKSAGAASRPRAYNRPARAPLSYSQQRLWFLDRLEPGSAAYNIPLGLRLRGELDPEVLQRSLNQMVRRHEVLRTSFEEEQAEPRQVIADSAAIDLPFTDLTALPAGEREIEVQRLAQEEARKPFDLGRAPLLRAKLLRLGAAEHVLLTTMHHIISDGWSIPVMTREIGEFYRAAVAGQEPRLRELPIQYADYAIWQREWLQGDVLEQQLAYWRNQLERVTALDLPTDHPRPEIMDHRGGSLRFQLSAELTDELKELSRRENATLFMTLMAAFQCLLGWYAKQSDIAVGTDIANRTHGDTEGLIGFFVNQLVIRGNLSGNPTFQGLLRQTRKTLLEAYAHQDMPFEKLVEALAPARIRNRAPLIEVKLVLLNMSQGLEADEEPGQLSIRNERLVPSTAKFDLLLTMWEYDGRLHGLMEYRAELFEKNTMDLLRTQFEQILNAVTQQPAICLDLLTQTLEMHQQRVLRQVSARKLSSIKRKEVPLAVR